MKEREHREEILDQSKTENHQGKLQTLHLHVWRRNALQISQLLSAFLTPAHFFSLGWFYFLLAAFLSSYPMALASLTSWGLQGNPGFTFTDPCSGLSRSPCRGQRWLIPGFSGFPYSWIVFHYLFFAPLILKPEPHRGNCQVVLLIGPGTRPLYSNKFSAAFSFA